ncbi:MAG: S41 family peptidase [Bacilli bacterium]|nr:S41 family peptidase [Bacilli bacterium]
MAKKKIKTSNKTNKVVVDKSNQKILEAKKIIKEQQKKIKLEKRAIWKKKRANFKKTKLGKLCFWLSDDRDSYSFSEVFGVTIISLALGAFACFSVFMIVSGGRNYFKMAKQLSKFYDVYDVITNNYYGELDKNELIEAAIDGMVSSVGDIYTNYNDVESTDSFNQLVNGTYEGIGCTITLKDEEVVIVDVYDNTPASKAELKSGDIIKSVDDKNALELGVNELSNYIKTEANGKIKMVIVRDKEEKTLTLERGKVEIPSVTSEIYEKNDKKIGFIRIDIFSSVTTKQFEKTIKELEKKEIDGLVIDVRDNNGGYLTSVTDIVSSLLPKGKVIYQIQSDKRRKVTKDKTTEKREYPIALLTNGGSASASEIMAAAIKESYNGYVVGTKTYGKGTVQQVKKLADGSMVKYTVENWLTPKGNWINEKGIEPTDEVELSEEYYKDPKVENDNQLQKALELVSK